MSAYLEENAGVHVLRLEERLGVDQAEALAAAVGRIFDAAGQRLAVDLSQVTYVGSIGLAACLRAAKLAKETGGSIAFAGLREPVREVFQISGFLELLPVHPTLEAAVETLRTLPVRTAPAAAQPAPETPRNPLSIPEEILLLALHDETGEIAELLPEHALEHALAGAVLSDLCMRHRIDSDLKHLVVIDPSPVGESFLDPALAAIAASTTTHDAQTWVRRLAREADDIRQRVLDRLVNRGVLRRAGKTFLWVLGPRRYPIIDERDVREVKRRVLGILKSNELPEPRDVVIIALADACAILDAALSMDEMLEARSRIAEVVRMDLIAQAMNRALVEAQSRPPEERRGIYDLRADGSAAP